MKVTRKSKLLFSVSSLSALMSALVSALLMSNAAWAHHSVASEFDTSTNIDVRGTITKVEWANPHIWLALDVVGADGKIAKWGCEMGSPNQLVRQGFKKENLPIGTVIRTQANPARDGSNTCSTRKITLDDGTPVFSRPSVQ